MFLREVQGETVQLRVMRSVFPPEGRRLLTTGAAAAAAGCSRATVLRAIERGELIDAETDLVYVLRRDVVYEPGKAVVGYVPDNVPMTFTVNEADEIVFLDQPSGVGTWSEVVERQAKQGRTRRPPTPR